MGRTGGHLHCGANSIGNTSDVQACFLRGPADTEFVAFIAGAPPEQAAIMAQRKKRVAARKRKAATRGKARKPAKSVRGKTAKRTSARATPRKRVTKAKSKRAVAKKVVPTVETVIVDMIEEPVPGVMVVTEFEATRIRGPNANLEQPKESRAAAPPESEER
jgi:hypothetical protein